MLMSHDLSVAVQANGVVVAPMYWYVFLDCRRFYCSMLGSYNLSSLRHHGGNTLKLCYAYNRLHSTFTRHTLLVDKAQSH